jgi:hypothetical protein
MQPTNGEWASGMANLNYANGDPAEYGAGNHWLWNCGGDCCCCLGACVCPGMAYAYNYVLATHPHNPDANLAHALCPFMWHTGLDLCVWGVGCRFGAPPGIIFPLSFLLRATHRQALFGHAAVAQSGGGVPESLAESIAVELLCWGCSLAEIYSHLKQHPHQHPNLHGVDLLGTLSTQPQYVNNLG